MVHRGSDPNFFLNFSSVSMTLTVYFMAEAPIVGEFSQ